MLWLQSWKTQSGSDRRITFHPFYIIPIENQESSRAASIFKNLGEGVWWCVPLILAPGRQRQVDLYKFEVHQNSQDCTEKSCLKKNLDEDNHIIFNQSFGETTQNCLRFKPPIPTNPKCLAHRRTMPLYVTPKLTDWRSLIIRIILSGRWFLEL